MCLTCGCGDEDNVRVLTAPGERPHEDHLHGHHHQHGHHHDEPTETVAIEEAILAKNDHLAEHNRTWFTERGITTLNLMSSPGSGKTTVLERTIAGLGTTRPVCVIEGDQETTFDADRIRRAGARAVQVNTGAGCHLDASMVEQAVAALGPEPGAYLFVENVGNLVCPALFDVGEHAKVVIISVTEGHDKPLKYPHMFSTADLVLVNKTDLLPYVDFDLDTFGDFARRLNPTVDILPVSAKSGVGIADWYGWLGRQGERSRS